CDRLRFTKPRSTRIERIFVTAGCAEGTDNPNIRVIRAIRGQRPFMQTDEYLKLAEVEDQMWYFRSLHGHVDRELSAALEAPKSNGPTQSAPGVLDAGCGTGGLILRLRARHPHWRFAGIDFMPLACELARQRCGPEIDIRVASITGLPFADRSFD